VLLTLALFADLLATSALPMARPGQSTLTYWLVGVLTATVFLITLLAHELAHAVVARRYRMRVQQITLWMLGGLTELDGQPPTPRADALIAAAGPLTSLGVGAVSAALAWTIGGTGLLAAALGWLAGVSLLLGVFNLLPGAPLDGGRLLRGVLWWRYRDRARAEDAAARAGRVLGSVLVALGFLEVLAGAYTGLWLALIGWFIISGAADERYAAQAERLAGLRAQDVMTATPTVLADWWTIQQLLTQLTPEQAAQSVFALIDFAGHATGTIALRDLERVPVHRRDDTRIRDLVGARRIQPLIVAGTANLSDIAMPLQLHGGLAVVVDSDAHPIGILTGADLARAATRRPWSATTEVSSPGK
jgi:Zn-dependent protease/CBS domain-containing protein